MKAPAFWSAPTPTFLARALAPAAAAWGAVAARGMARPRPRAGLPVVCVGNFTAGGAGKTPAAIALARMLLANGETPAFVTRGFGGRGGRGAPLRVDPARHGAGDVGDEPLLLARVAPTFVAADRLAGAQAAQAQGASVVVLDDGLQGAGPAHDFALCVVDAPAGFGNGRVMPAGPLRAPLAAQWPRVAGIVLVGEGGAAIEREALARDKFVAAARLEPDAGIARDLRGKRVLAFAGIGRPGKFFATLEALGAEVAARRAFADHRPYGAADMARLRAEAKGLGLALVTTEKDAARIADMAGIAVLPVTLAFDAPGAMQARLAEALSRRRAS